MINFEIKLHIFCGIKLLNYSYYDVSFDIINNNRYNFNSILDCIQINDNAFVYFKNSYQKIELKNWDPIKIDPYKFKDISYEDTQLLLNDFIKKIGLQTHCKETDIKFYILPLYEIDP